MGVFVNIFLAMLMLAQPADLLESYTGSESYNSKGEDKNSFDVFIYPKVSKIANEELNVVWSNSEEKVTMMITDVFDKVLYNRYTTVSGKATILDVSNLDKGVYKLVIRKGAQKKTLKFIRME